MGPHGQNMHLDHSNVCIGDDFLEHKGLGLKVKLESVKESQCILCERQAARVSYNSFKVTYHI